MSGVILQQQLFLPACKKKEMNNNRNGARIPIKARLRFDSNCTLEELKRDSESCIFIQQQGASKQQSERPVCKGKMPPPLPIEVLLLFVSNDDFK
mmetsp:Transcript_25856/g.41592  ORF Transcript_25856/g.41592 Transcript_25856/m.41592 type:complete len:95 (-) Transcript_25856:14-298(-)